VNPVVHGPDRAVGETPAFKSLEAQTDCRSLVGLCSMFRFGVGRAEALAVGVCSGKDHSS